MKYKSAIGDESFVGDLLLGLDEVFDFGIVGYVIEWERFVIPFFSRGFYRFDHIWRGLSSGFSGHGDDVVGFEAVDDSTVVVLLAEFGF